MVSDMSIVFDIIPQLCPLLPVQGFFPPRIMPHVKKLSILQKRFWKHISTFIVDQCFVKDWLIEQMSNLYLVFDSNDGRFDGKNAKGFGITLG